MTKIGSLRRSVALFRTIKPVIASSDLVHVHSNGLLPELGALVGSWTGKPVVLTLYGTEIWHYRPRRFGPDPFTRAYRGAGYITFYSRGLEQRAIELGLQRGNAETVYPPVADGFAIHDPQARAEARRSLGFSEKRVLLNVKRLHPLAGQRYLIEALPDVVRVYPDTQLVFCGSGPLEKELQTLARRLDVANHVTFAGLVDNDRIPRYYAAADVFVLPSLLEALATVAVEALACGTPVVSSDNAAGVELNALFGPDVVVVPRREPQALAEAVLDLLASKRRTNVATADVIEREFRPRVVAARYRDIYRRLLNPTA